jgi:glucosamine--fructose-6-phosphate aminotransferase (isomerizing)
MSGNHKTQATNTQNEILSQPHCWEECFKELENCKPLESVAEQVNPDAVCLFIGCGSSYYVAQAAAASWTHITGMRARAVPASELLLFPDLVLMRGVEYQPVLISRSGNTSEVLQAAEYLERQRNMRTLVISCTADQPLDALASFTLHLLSADEKSIVMTRSFTSMVLGLQYLAGRVAGGKDFAQVVEKLAMGAQRVLDLLDPRIREFVHRHDFADYVFLAQGPLAGIASEGQLKVAEMSCSYAQMFHTLEFRHGPKAIVGPETLVTFLLSESAAEAEREVLEEVKQLGGTTLVITNRADAVARSCADLLVELSLDVPEYHRLIAYVLPLQLLGLYTGLKKGFDPDQPRNLSRAVILTK